MKTVVPCKKRVVADSESAHVATPGHVRPHFESSPISQPLVSAFIKDAVRIRIAPERDVVDEPDVRDNVLSRQRQQVTAIIVDGRRIGLQRSD